MAPPQIGQQVGPSIGNIPDFSTAGAASFPGTGATTGGLRSFLTNPAFLNLIGTALAGALGSGYGTRAFRERMESMENLKRLAREEAMEREKLGISKEDLRIRKQAEARSERESREQAGRLTRQEARETTRLTSELARNTAETNRINQEIQSGNDRRASVLALGAAKRRLLANPSITVEELEHDINPSGNELVTAAIAEALEAHSKSPAGIQATFKNILGRDLSPRELASIGDRMKVVEEPIKITVPKPLWDAWGKEIEVRDKNQEVKVRTEMQEQLIKRGELTPTTRLLMEMEQYYLSLGKTMDEARKLAHGDVFKKDPESDLLKRAFDDAADIVSGRWLKVPAWAKDKRGELIPLSEIAARLYREYSESINAVSGKPSQDPKMLERARMLAENPELAVRAYQIDPQYTMILIQEANKIRESMGLPPIQIPPSATPPQNLRNFPLPGEAGLPTRP